MLQSHQDQEVIETTLWALVCVIDGVTNSYDESFAVLESMLSGGRISIVSPPDSCAA